MGIKRGTTPTIPLTVDTDLTGWTVHVTFKCDKSQITLDNSRLTIEPSAKSTDINVMLTQQETLSLGVGDVEVEVRAIKDEIAIATDIKKINVSRILEEGVINELP